MEKCKITQIDERAMRMREFEIWSVTAKTVTCGTSDTVVMSFNGRGLWWAPEKIKTNMKQRKQFSFREGKYHEIWYAGFEPHWGQVVFH